MKKQTVVEKARSLFPWNRSQGEAVCRQALQPDEVDALILDALHNQGRMVGGRLDIPFTYEVFVSPEDYDSYYGLRSEMVGAHLVDLIQTYSEESDAWLGEMPTVVFQVDGSLGFGSCRVECSYSNNANAVGETPAAGSPSAHLKEMAYVTPSCLDARKASATPGGFQRSETVGAGRKARLEAGGRRYDLHAGCSIGVVRDRSRKKLPDIEISLNENKYAHQIHGRFDCGAEGSRWQYTNLDKNGTLIRCGDDSVSLEAGELRILADGDALQFPQGEAFTFVEE